MCRVWRWFFAIFEFSSFYDGGNIGYRKIDRLDYGDPNWKTDQQPR